MKEFAQYLITLLMSATLLLWPLEALTLNSQWIVQELAPVRTAEGVHSVNFDFPAGRVRVFLPDDMAAGDTISGTVAVEPKGKTDEERSKNQDTLNGTVLDLGDSQKILAKQSQFKFVPAIQKSLAKAEQLFRITAVYPEAIAPTPVAHVPLATTSASAPLNFELPQIGQTGHFSQVLGPFDGDLSTTKCSVGGAGSALIAESPRKSVFRNPYTIVGPTEIVYSEGSTTSSGSYRNVKINLSSPKTNLMKGEKTVVTVQVEGLQGISAATPVELVTTGTVQMRGGNAQTIQIAPEQVDAAGNFMRTFDLTGTSAGAFSVTGTLKAGEPVANKEKCKCNCEFAKPAITSDTTRSADGSGTENTFSPNMKRADCTGSKCSVQGISYSWTIGGASTATHTIRKGTDKSGKLIVEVTKGGTLVITVTVTVTCSDGTKCSDTATETVTVKG